MTDDINTALNSCPDRIRELDENLMIDLSSVGMAMDSIRTALDRIDACLSRSEFSKASDVGYRDLAHEFVHVQRTLGALQGTDDRLSVLIQDVAGQVKRPFEDVEPAVKARLKSCR